MVRDLCRYKPKTPPPDKRSNDAEPFHPRGIIVIGGAELGPEQLLLLAHPDPGAEREQGRGDDQAADSWPNAIAIAIRKAAIAV